jgi:hypothetical protein
MTPWLRFRDLRYIAPAAILPLSLRLPALVQSPRLVNPSWPGYSDLILIHWSKVLLIREPLAQGGHPLVMTADETSACAWPRDRATWSCTVLTPPGTDQFIPAWAGNRVVYGHPFETIDAETKKSEAAQFYSPAATPSERRTLLDRYGVRYVLAPIAVNLDPEALGLSSVWTGNDDILYHVEVAQ